MPQRFPASTHTVGASLQRSSERTSQRSSGRSGGRSGGAVGGLAAFINTQRKSIVAEWETFAGTLGPAADEMTAKGLRDHADDILTAIVHDMKSRQTAAEQAEKSKGRGEAQKLSTVGELHAALRLESGFKLGQLVAEYRALRASVLRLWEKKGTDPAGVTRFNEAIDEALAVAVEQFSKTTEHYRDQSLGILGHDLRNPLAAIINGASLLIDAPSLDDRSVSIAARMLSSGKRMERMINDLLDLTRTRFGDVIPVTPAPIDLEPLCRQVVAELEGLREGIVLRFTAKGDLRGEWDGDRIAQVLSNLLRNAIQHGDPTVPIDVTATAVGEAVHVEVHNAGPPIPRRALGTMFEPMIRHASDDQRNSGLGLGLYIASQIINAHGGKLEVTSTERAGTTFRIELPRTPATR